MKKDFKEIQNENEILSDKVAELQEKIDEYENIIKEHHTEHWI
jgi:hypothetical protein